jgi:peptidoglycan/xylan/chitin deacetylase (PgdA/CDA1 family)
MSGREPIVPERGLSGSGPQSRKGRVTQDARGRARYGPSGPAGRRPPGARPPGPSRRVLLRRRLFVLAAVGLLVLGTVTVVRLLRPGAQLSVAWHLSPASNTVTIALTPGNGTASRAIQASSHLTVTEEVNGRPARWSRYGRVARITVRPGTPTRLLVQVKGPHPFSRVLSVTAPPPLRVLSSHAGAGGLLLSLSGPLRRPRPGRLCRRDVVTYPAPAEVAVARSPYACRSRLTLTARTGEQAVVPVTIATVPEIPLYAFASSARRAIYITVDDGWTPSAQVLAIMRRTRLPVTAFLIQDAAQQNLPYWRAFVAAGGTVGDHTVSHPDLSTLTLSQATAQWAQARQALGKWLGAAPVLGRPPYGDFNPAVEAAAYRAGLGCLVGWSATVDNEGIHTWDGQGLEPGEIVLLHWVPGLGHQLTELLAAIQRRHLRPMPLTAASFAGITPQLRSLGGD